jgi:replication factor A1
MKEELKREYERIKDRISPEEFEELIEKKKEELGDIGFMDDLTIASTVVDDILKEKNTMLSEKPEHRMDTISKLEEGAETPVTGRVMKISSPRTFTTRKGREGKLANVIIADDTGELRAVFWTENIKLLKKFREGDVIRIKDVNIRGGFGGRKEAHLMPRSTVEVLDPEDFPDFPEYREEITPIGDLVEDEEVSVIARITGVSRVRTFERDGREGRFISLDIMDATGSTTYTLWNNDVNLVEELGLKEGDAVKILWAQTRRRDDKVTLTHTSLTRVVPGEYDVPEFREELVKIGDLHEMRNVTVMGLVTKVNDPVEFERNDGTTGSVKSIEIADDTGSARVTLWDEDTRIKINKGDIIRISGANVEFDDFNQSYRINTNFNTRITLNPESDGALLKVLEEYREQMRPMKISEILEMEDEGEEVDVVGRIFSLSDPREFEREDGTGIVRSMELADETGKIRISLWDEKAEKPMNIGDAVRIENARIRLGLYSVELSAGRTTRIVNPLPEDMEDLPSFEELEEMLYQTKKIADLEEDDRNIRIIARVVDLFEPREFQRGDGTPGLVRTAEFADDTGSIRASLWDDAAEKPLSIGDPVKIENPRVVFRDDMGGGRLELSIGNSSRIEPASERDLEGLPSFDELQEMLYPHRDIADLDEDSRNVLIEGELIEMSGRRILSIKCPSCNERLDLSDENICNFCGELVDEPRYLLMIPGRIMDDTGEVMITFFGREAESILEMTTDEVVNIINQSADESALEERVEDLNGVTVRVIGNADMDVYSEELRFIPRKVVKKEL